MKIRKLRSITQVLKYLKENDSETAITRFYIESLILKDKIYHIKSGNKHLVDLDEVLYILGIFNDKSETVNKHKSRKKCIH